MNSQPRMSPGSACEACRRLKMKCVKEYGLPCERCQRTKRECVPLSAARGSTVHMKRTPNISTVRNQHQRPEALSPDCATTSTSPTSAILPSIYSTSPYANHVAQGQQSATVSDHGKGFDSTQKVQSKGQVADYDTPSTDDVVELIEIFREKLLLAIPILHESDYADAPRLITEFPNLTTCIVYVTTRYIPGYEKVRRTTRHLVSTFLETAFGTDVHDTDEQMATMQALIILYFFTRGYATGKSSPSQSVEEISFWQARAMCEAFALNISLHKAVVVVKQQIEEGKQLNKMDISTRKYLFWLWLYTSSHYMSLITGTPPTLAVDDSIRAAPILLQSLAADGDIFVQISEVRLCLIWDKLGAKDYSLREWWCSTNLALSNCNVSWALTLQDVDLALEVWRNETRVIQTSVIQKGLLSLQPEYLFHFTRFCLNTHFIRNIESTNLQPHQVQAIERCMDSALSLLRLSRRISPAIREQLRYLPGFLFVIVSFCSSFVLQALQIFYSIFPRPEPELDLVRTVGNFMTELGTSNGYGAWIAGRSVLRQLEATIELISRRPPHGELLTQQRLEAIMDSNLSTNQEVAVMSGEEINSLYVPFGNDVFAFPDFFDQRLMG